jgi:hypothetical protein
MGYWGVHPMEGDSPLDDRFVIHEQIEDENEDFDELSNDVVVRRLRDRLPAIYEAVMTKVDEGSRFVLPFTIAENRIRIKDAKMSAQIKELIGDGGHAHRGYDPAAATGTFETPKDFADQLYQNWDQLMDGTLPFNVLKPSLGLLASAFGVTREMVEAEQATQTFS